ncbi:MAG TPA: low affinity iron permease family protein [bacterium]|nr:low affinity iron permease family protein [bacterium]
MNDQPVNWYTRLTRVLSRASGRQGSFLLALLVILIWAATGPFFHFSDTWQLVINTGTTIITFLMVFLIQNTQNRDTEALQVKLDELIRVTEGAQNALLDLEDLDESNIEEIRAKYGKLAELARKTKNPDAQSAHRRAETRSPRKNGRNEARRRAAG